MYCINKEIKKVSGTKLFCAINDNKTRQITIYENTVNNISKNNVLVLYVLFINSIIFQYILKKIEKKNI